MAIIVGLQATQALSGSLLRLSHKPMLNMVFWCGGKEIAFFYDDVYLAFKLSLIRRKMGFCEFFDAKAAFNGDSKGVIKTQYSCGFKWFG